MMRQLLWKEWRQQRWKLAYGCALLMGAVAILLRSRLQVDVFMVIVSAGAGSLLMGLIVGMSVVADDSSEGSITMLLSLPVESWKVLAAKLAVGAAVCVVPILGMMAVAVWIAGGREISSGRIVASYSNAVLFVLAFMLWTVVFGMRQKSEARVGLLAIGLLLGWFFAAVVVQEILGIQRDVLMLAWTPLGLLASVAVRGQPLWEYRIVFGAQAVISSVVLGIGFFRFSRLSRSLR